MTNVLGEGLHAHGFGGVMTGIEHVHAKLERIERRARLGDAILRQLIISRPGKDFERIKEQRAKAAENAAAAAIAAAAAAASSAGSYES